MVTPSPIPGLEITDACNDLLNKVNDLLTVLDPLIENLKLQVEDIAQEASNYVGSVSDDLKAVANEIMDQVDGAFDQIAEMLAQSATLLQCALCVGISTEKELQQTQKTLENFGETVNDLESNGLQIIHNLTQFPQDMINLGYRISNDFLRKLSTLPETAFSVGVAALAAKYSPINFLLEEVDCIANCIAGSCPELATEIDVILTQIETMRANIKIKEDGSLDMSAVLTGSSLDFQNYFEATSNSVTSFKDNIKDSTQIFAKTFSKRKEQETTDETGAAISEEDAVANVRASDMAEYGWPAGQDGEYEITVTINSKAVTDIFTNLENNGKNIKDIIKNYSALLSGIELSSDGLIAKLKSDFLISAPPVPRGKGNIPVELKIANLAKTLKNTAEQSGLEWSAIVSQIDTTVAGINATNKFPSIVRDSDPRIESETLNKSMAQIAVYTKNMDEDTAIMMTPFIEKVVSCLSYCAIYMAQNLKL